VLDTPGTVNIFTAEDIEKGGYANVADVINGLPGITNSTTNPALPKYNFRGTAYAHSRGATIYVDGREINTGRIGYGDLNFVDINDVEQIQVIKTPGTQFSEPSRGVVYITTKKGKKDGHFQRLKGQYGSWALHKENVSAWGKEGDIDYRISANNQGGDGYRHTQDERKDMNLKAGYAFGASTRLGFGGGFKDQHYFSATSLEKWQWDRDPRDNTPPNDQDNPTYDLSPYEYDVQIYDVFADFNLDQARWFAKSLLSFMHNETEYLFQKNKNRPSYANGNDTSTYLRDFDEDRLVLKASGGYKSRGETLRNTLALGMEYDAHDYDQIRTYPFLDEPDATRTRYMQQYDLEISIDRISVFLNNDFGILDHFALQTGLRYDNVELSFQNAYAGDPDVENTYKKTSWNISPSYSFTGSDNLYFTAGQSYFYPNIDYARMSAQKDDEHPENDPSNLKPEEIMTYELGFKHQLNRFFNYSIAAFYMVVNDKFIFQYRYDEEDDEWDSLGAVNLGRAVHKGFEIEMDGRLSEWFGYRLNYGYLDAKWDDPDVVYSSCVWEEDPADDYREGSSIDGKRLYRTPEHKATATLLFFPTRKLSAWLNVTYVDDQYVDYLERVIQPSVTTFDVKMAYKFNAGAFGPLRWKGLTLHGLVINLTDENYAYYSNARGERNDDGSLATDFYPYPGRYFEVGLTVDF
jgi:iron complex outermembrane receptor protein